MGCLRNRFVLVTGAAGAVGSAVVSAIVQEGGQVLATDVQPRALEKAFGHDDSVESATLDVAQEQHWQRLIDWLRSERRQLDGLVTCAAIFHAGDGGVEAVSRDAWDDTQRVNVAGVLFANKAVIPLMKSAGRGSIVHVSSIAASRGSATSHVAYTASKGAVAAMTRDVAVMYASYGIRVNTIASGLLATRLTAGLVADPTELERRLAHIPLGRLGLPHEVASAAIWLLSDAASYVTGTELVVDGGIGAAFVTGRE